MGMTLEGVSICLVTLYVVTRAGTFPGRLLNTSALRHMGVISYSLYLWQSILISEDFGYFPYNLAAILVCAELSYWGVERPALRVRDRLLRRAGGESSSGSLALSAEAGARQSPFRES